MRSGSPLAALVLDMDGIVADTEPIAAAALTETYGTAGIVLDEPELRGLVGLEFGRIEPLLRTRHAIAVAADVLRAEFHRRHMAKLRQGVEPSPGLFELVAEFAAAGIPVGVASSSPLPQVELVLAAAGLLARVDVVAAGSEVERTKPAPDVYLLALRRLGVDAARAVAVEDSVTGVAAARAAGLVCVGVRTASTAGHDLGGAALVVDSLRELSLERLVALVAG